MFGIFWWNEVYGFMIVICFRDFFFRIWVMVVFRRVEDDISRLLDERDITVFFFKWKVKF